MIDITLKEEQLRCNTVQLCVQCAVLLQFMLCSGDGLRLPSGLDFDTKFLQASLSSSQTAVETQGPCGMEDSLDTDLHLLLSSTNQ